MEKQEKKDKNGFDKSIYNPYAFKAYKVVKKIVKYSFYTAIIYFACVGFMTWE